MPEDTFYVEGIQIAKRGISMDIQKFLPEMAETKFVETFKYEPKPVPATSEPKPEEAKPKEKKAEKKKNAEPKTKGKKPKEKTPAP